MNDDPDSEAFEGKPEPWWYKFVFPVVAVAIFTVLFSCSGCAYWKRGAIKSPMGSVVGVPDAGKAATLATDAKWEEMMLPKGSSLTLTKFGATVATSDKPAEPAREVTAVVLSEPTAWKKTENVFQANTGTVDISLAAHRIDAAESRPLLYAAILAAVGVAVFMWLKYPTPAMICGAASVIFFLSWKLSGLPDWFYVLGVCGLVAAAAIWFAHERGEKHAKGLVPP